MSKADFLNDSLTYKEHEFNGKKCFLKEMDAQEYATVIDVVKQTFKEGVENEVVLDVLFKAFVVSITLHDEDKQRVFDPNSQEDLEAVASVKYSSLTETYNESMRLASLQGFIGEEPPKKPEA